MSDKRNDNYREKNTDWINDTKEIICCSEIGTNLEIVQGKSFLDTGRNGELEGTIIPGMSIKVESTIKEEENVK